MLQCLNLFSEAEWLVANINRNDSKGDKGNGEDPVEERSVEEHFVVLQLESTEKMRWRPRWGEEWERMSAVTDSSWRKSGPTLS